MPKKAKNIPVPCVEYKPPPENYKEKYEFKKPPSVRAPVEGWQQRDMMQNPQYYSHSPKEMRLVRGTPHKFKGVRTNNPYRKGSK